MHHQVSSTVDVVGHSFGPIKPNFVPVFLVTDEFSTSYDEVLMTYHQDFGVSCPRPALEPPSELLRRVIDFVLSLQLVRITISSPHLTVASLVLFEFSLLSPPEGLVVTNLNGFVTQTVAVEYRESRKVLRPPPTTEILFSVDAEPPRPNPMTE